MNYTPADKVTVDGVTYEVTDPRAVVDVERDLAEHNGRWANESWFVVSNLESAGQRIGLQVHLLVQRLPGGVDIAQLNVVVVNESTGISRTAEYIHPLDQIELATDRMHLSTPELTWSGDSHGFTLTLDGDVAKIDLTTVATGPELLMNGQGEFPFLGEKQFEFALPAMRTTGSVVLESTTYEVTGLSWLDRQWGGLPAFFTENLGKEKSDAAPASPMNWIWTNPQLDNGVNVAVAQLRDMMNGKIYLALTAVHADGTHVVVPRMEPVEMSEQWTSPATGRRYPTRCVVRAPQIDTELVIEVPYKAQEIVSSEAALTKYEGAAVVTGTYQGEQVTGQAYLELVGDWS